MFSGSYAALDLSTDKGCFLEMGHRELAVVTQKTNDLDGTRKDGLELLRAEYDDVEAVHVGRVNGARSALPERSLLSRRFSADDAIGVERRTRRVRNWASSSGRVVHGLQVG